MEALLERATQVISLLSRPGADPDRTLAKQSSHDLRSILCALASQVQANPLCIGPSEKKQVWELACKVWNFCVYVGNSGEALESWQARLRHTASDLAGLVHGQQDTQEEAACKLEFFHTTGQAYAELRELEAAEACFAKAAEFAASLLSSPAPSGEAPATEHVERAVELHMERAVVAWALRQPDLALSQLAKAHSIIASGKLPAIQAIHLALKAVQVKLDRAQELLEGSQGSSGVKQKAEEAVGLLEGAHEEVTNLEMDEDDPAVEECSSAAANILQQVLSCLVLAYVLAGDRALPAMACIGKLREVRGAAAADPSTAFLALQALIQLERHKEAESELLAMAACDTAPQQLCVEAISAMLEVEGFSGSILSAISMVLKRASGDPQLPVRFVELCLCKSDSKASCREYESLALDVIRSEEVMSALLQADTDQSRAQQQRLHELLWNHAARYFQAKQYSEASRFFAADLQMSPQPEKPKVARSMAVCCLAMSQLDRALEYVAIAEQEGPGGIYNSFIAFKVRLEKGEPEGASQELAKMIKSSEFSQEFLTVAAHEAVNGNHPSVAREALQQLHSILAKADDAHSREATVLCNLIRVTTDAAQAEGRPSYAEVAPLFGTAAERARTAGGAAFFAGADGRLHQLEWFASSSWNYALAAVKHQDIRSAALMFTSSSEFHAMFPQQTLDRLNSQKAACLMAATADLQVHKEGGGDQASLASAASNLSACRQVMERIQREHHWTAPADVAATFCLLQEFDLALRLKDRAKQSAALAQCQRAAGISADHLMQLAALSGSTGSPTLEKECLSMALKRLTQGTPITALHLVAEVLRRILCLSNCDEEKLGLYRDARTLLQDTPAGRFPAQEAAWLVTTCFNRGCQHAKFCRFDTALEFMQAALGLLPFCPELSTKKEHMTAEVERLEARRNKDGERCAAVRKKVFTTHAE